MGGGGVIKRRATHGLMADCLIVVRMSLSTTAPAPNPAQNSQEGNGHIAPDIGFQTA